MTLGTGPVLGRVVEQVEGAEALRVFVLELLKLALEDDILFADVAKDERDLGLVFGILEDGASELPHGRDAGASSNQRNVVVLVGLPGVLGNGTLEVEPLARVHVVKLRGHGTVGVVLDNKIEVSHLVCRQPSVNARPGRFHACGSNYLRR